MQILSGTTERAGWAAVKLDARSPNAGAVVNVGAQDHVRHARTVSTGKGA